MTDSATDYIAFLRAVANETADPVVSPPHTTPEHPTLFLMETLSAVLQRQNGPPTRHGLDAVCDILFSHPAIAPLIADADQSAALQAHFADRYLRTAVPQTLHDHWTYIVLPAWQQHTELQSTMRLTATD
ncbi:hypothetical protein EBX31_05665 [bacterium]|nr:hypothetical protein [bacterium]